MIPCVLERFIQRMIQFEPMLGVATLGIMLQVPVVSMKSILELMGGRPVSNEVNSFPFLSVCVQLLLHEILILEKNRKMQMPCAYSFSSAWKEEMGSRCFPMLGWTSTVFLPCMLERFLDTLRARVSRNLFLLLHSPEAQGDKPSRIPTSSRV